MSILKIALTGGIACGKSSVCKIFEEIGVPTIELDSIARRVVESGTKGFNELVAKFGQGILNTDKTLNRKILRQHLFASTSNKQHIEQILHPKILAEMQANIKKLDTDLVVVEVALLVEQNLYALFERAIVIDCSTQNQLNRLLKRKNIDENLAKKMIASQANSSQRLALGKKLPIDVINNNADMLALEQTVKKLAKKLFNL